MWKLAHMKKAVPLASLGWLYLVQGIPYGLQDKFIPVQLRSLGLQYSSVSLLKILLVPWIAKGLWAPIVEVWGGRHRWLVCSLLALAGSSYAGSYIAPDDVLSIGCMLLALNVFSAVQDVAVDGLALQVLTQDQLGLGNTIQVVLYKVGCFVGGAGLTHLLVITDWTITFTILAFLYFCTAVWATYLPNKSIIPGACCKQDTKDNICSNNTYSKRERLAYPTKECTGQDYAMKKNTGQDRTTKENTEQDPASALSLHSQGDPQTKQVFSILKEVINTPGTLWLSVYVLLYKMGERGAINNMPLYLLDKGLSKQSLAFWNGTVCQGLSIIGSFYGGIVLLKPNVNNKTMLIKHSTYRLVSVMIQYLVIIFFELFRNFNTSVLHSIGIVSLCSISYSSGVISTASFTLMMTVSRECSVSTQASHYSALASVEVAGKLLFATLAGFIIDYVGMSWTFALLIILCTIPLIVLKAMPEKLCHLKEE
ncbi:major facilitator superfamily domain-containing protein 3 isoform X1 [Procambarus clarkii]|uniref:major facilitator superfamily domain-containing protein 3 isoform X1 n=1 Tax=Procambarus clarkii TaxID=6728 RepID=UPI0037427843